MSAALKFTSPPQSSDGAQATAPPANDNCHLQLLVKSVIGGQEGGKTIYNVYDASGTLVHIDKVTDNDKQII